MTRQSCPEKQLRAPIQVSVIAAILLYGALQGVVPAFAQGLATLDAVVAAHGVNRLSPLSVQMTGMIDRGVKPEPFRLLATRDEELRVEYGTSGTDTRVTTSKWAFQDNGQKSTARQAGSGFSQLDVTGLFLVEQLRNRAVRVDPTDNWVQIAGVNARRIRVTNERFHKIPGRVRVDDRLDLYVTETGLIAAISRTLYEGRPERYMATWVFSDYRETNDKVRLPYRIELYVNGKKREALTVENYVFDATSNREMFLPRRSQ